MKKSVLIIVFVILLTSLVIAGQLQVTNEHPFLINGKWIPASSLEVGDELTALDGSHIIITSIKDIKLQNPIHVFNLEANQFSNFIIADKLIVHNSDSLSDVQVLKSRVNDVMKSQPSIEDSWFCIEGGCQPYSAQMYAGLGDPNLEIVYVSHTGIPLNIGGKPVSGRVGHLFIEGENGIIIDPTYLQFLKNREEIINEGVSGVFVGTREDLIEHLETIGGKNGENLEPQLRDGVYSGRIDIEEFVDLHWGFGELEGFKTPQTEEVLSTYNLEMPLVDRCIPRKYTQISFQRNDKGIIVPSRLWSGIDKNNLNLIFTNRIDSNHLGTKAIIRYDELTGRFYPAFAEETMANHHTNIDTALLLELGVIPSDKYALFVDTGNRDILKENPEFLENLENVIGIELQLNPETNLITGIQISSAYQRTQNKFGIKFSQKEMQRFLDALYDSIDPELLSPELRVAMESRCWSGTSYRGIDTRELIQNTLRTRGMGGVSPKTSFEEIREFIEQVGFESELDAFGETINEEIVQIQNELLGDYNLINNPEYGDIYAVDSPTLSDDIEGLKYYFRKKGDNYVPIGMFGKGINTFWALAKSEEIESIEYIIEKRGNSGIFEDIGIYGRTIILSPEKGTTYRYSRVERWIVEHGLNAPTSKPMKTPSGELTYVRNDAFENPEGLMAKFIRAVGDTQNPQDAYIIGINTLGVKTKIIWSVRKDGSGLYEIDFSHAIMSH